MQTIGYSAIRSIILAAIILVMPSSWAISQNESGPVWTDIVQAGAPIVLVESEGTYQWRSMSDGSTVQSFSLQTDQLALLRRFWAGNTSPPRILSHGPVLRITVDWDRITGVYELKRVALGFFSKRMWLAYDVADPEDDHGAFSIQIRKEW